MQTRIATIAYHMNSMLKNSQDSQKESKWACAHPHPALRRVEPLSATDDHRPRPL